MPESAEETVVYAVELCLLAAGVVLLWRHVLRPSARTRWREPAALAAWGVSLPDFFLFLLIIISAVLAVSFAAGLILKPFKLSAGSQTILGTAFFQLGLLIGPAVLPLGLGHHPLRPPLTRATLLSGAGTFLIALPIVTLVSLVWLGLLNRCGIAAEKQDVMQLFLEAKSSGLIFVLIGFATLVAPVGEELLFRATLFRFLRTRIPRWAALLLPAMLFAAFHQNLAAFAPLVALAVIFSLAYERTGYIGTAMVAHGLFNLHTIALLLAGVTP